MTGRIDVTVAAVIEQERRFLIVEEQVGERAVLNQPAGHLEPDESLLEAVTRETLEETGYRFEADAVLGLYLLRCAGNGISYLRVAFCGRGQPPESPPRLDHGILATHWLSRTQLAQRAAELRSPLVLRCIDDFAAGVRYPLDLLTHLGIEDGARKRRLA